MGCQRRLRDGPPFLREQEHLNQMHHVKKIENIYFARIFSGEFIPGAAIWLVGIMGLPSLMTSFFWMSTRVVKIVLFSIFQVVVYKSCHNKHSFASQRTHIVFFTFFFVVVENLTTKGIRWSTRFSWWSMVWKVWKPLVHLLL